MRLADISKKHGVHVTFAYLLLSGGRKTTNIPLCLALGKFSGKKPIEFFSKKRGLRDIALAAHPELNVVHKRTVLKSA